MFYYFIQAKSNIGELCITSYLYSTSGAEAFEVMSNKKLRRTE